MHTSQHTHTHTHTYFILSHKDRSVTEIYRLLIFSRVQNSREVRTRASLIRIRASRSKSKKLIESIRRYRDIWRDAARQTNMVQQKRVMDDSLDGEVRDVTRRVCFSKCTHPRLGLNYPAFPSGGEESK